VNPCRRIGCPGPVSIVVDRLDSAFDQFPALLAVDGRPDGGGDVRAPIPNPDAPVDLRDERFFEGDANAHSRTMAHAFASVKFDRSASDTSDMREPTYFILAALQDGPLHGYGIIKRTEVLSDQRLTLAAGTLYGALDRLVATGFVTSGPSYVENGRPRRDYELTDAGSTALVAEAARLAQASRVVRIPRPHGLAAEGVR
jgi:PadR family transcriptional regulator, regulatory protein PadR